MRRFHRFRIRVLVVAVVVGLLAAGPVFADAHVLKIGFVGVMSGPNASWGLVNRYCAEVTAKMYNAMGGVGRAPLDWHGYHLEKTMPAFRDACQAIKSALDPNGILAPGRYGIH